MSLFAQIQDGIVSRVIVADSIEWCQSRLGGTWIETRDDDPQANFAGPGMGYDPNALAKFALPWVQRFPGVEPGHQPGDWVWLDDRLWQNFVDGNYWRPGDYGWRDHTNGNIPVWVQPAGAGDAFRLGNIVTRHGRIYLSNHDANVWEPGSGGIGSDIWEDITEPPLADEFPEWKPWDGHNANLYQVDDKVTYESQRWIAVVGNNHWRPDEYGWELIE